MTVSPLLRHELELDPAAGASAPLQAGLSAHHGLRRRLCEVFARRLICIHAVPHVVQCVSNSARSRSEASLQPSPAVSSSGGKTIRHAAKILFKRNSSGR